MALLFDEALAGAVATRVGVVLLPDADADVLTLLVGCAVLVLLTLLLLPMPPLVDTLLVNTLSDPVYLRLPCHLSSW